MLSRVNQTINFETTLINLKLWQDKGENVHSPHILFNNQSKIAQDSTNIRLFKIEDFFITLLLLRKKCSDRSDESVTMSYKCWIIWVKKRKVWANIWVCCNGNRHIRSFEINKFFILITNKRFKKQQAFRELAVISDERGRRD